MLKLCLPPKLIYAPNLLGGPRPRVLGGGLSLRAVALGSPPTLFLSALNLTIILSLGPQSNFLFFFFGGPEKYFYAGRRPAPGIGAIPAPK